MDFGWMVLESFNAIFEVCLMRIFAQGMIRTKKTGPKPLQYGVFGLAVVVSFAVSVLFMGNVVIMALKTVLVAFFITMAYCGTKLYGIIACSALSLLISILAELSAGFLIMLNQEVDFDLLAGYTPYRFFTILLSDLIWFLLIQIALRVRKGNLTSLSRKDWVPFLLFPVFSIVITIQAGSTILQGDGKSLFLSALGLLGLLYSNIFIFVLFERAIRHSEDKNRLALLETQLAIQKEHNEKIAQNQMYTQQMSHDFKQYTQGFLRLCETGNYEELTEEIRQLLKRQQTRVNAVIQTGNPMLDAVLTAKKDTAEKEGIGCFWDFHIPPDLPLPIIDLIALLGNALDNAIEACLRAGPEKEKAIIFHMKTNGQALFCEIKNTTGALPLKQDGTLRTLKQDGKHHGIGQQSMVECCKRLNGRMSYDFDEKLFELRIFIPW